MTVRLGNTFRFCGTYPTPRSTNSCALKPVMLSSPNLISPPRTEHSPKMALSTVDLPAPFGPMTPTNSPCPTVMLQPFKIFTSGIYPATNSFTSSTEVIFEPHPREMTLGAGRDMPRRLFRYLRFDLEFLRR